MGLVAQSLNHDPVLRGAFTGTPLVLVVQFEIALLVAASIFGLWLLARMSRRKHPFEVVSLWFCSR